METEQILVKHEREILNGDLSQLDYTQQLLKEWQAKKNYYQENLLKKNTFENVTKDFDFNKIEEFVNEGKKDFKSFETEYQKISQKVNNNLKSYKIDIQKPSDYKFTLELSNQLQKNEDEKKETKNDLKKETKNDLKKSIFVSEENEEEQPKQSEIKQEKEKREEEEREAFGSFGTKKKIELKITEKNEQSISQEQTKNSNEYEEKNINNLDHKRELKLKKRFKTTKIQPKVLSLRVTTLNLKSQRDIPPKRDFLQKSNIIKNPEDLYGTQTLRRNRSVIIGQQSGRMSHGVRNPYKYQRDSTPRKTQQNSDAKSRSFLHKSLINKKKQIIKSKQTSYAVLIKRLIKELNDSRTKTIRISSVSLKSFELDEIFNLIKSYRPMINLILTDMNLKDSDIVNFITVMMDYKVNNIDLSNNGLTIKSLRILFKFIQENNNVKSLNLQGNNITDDNLQEKVRKFKRKGCILLVD